MEYTDDGLFSIPIFGNLVSQQLYACRCGKYSGKYYAGKFCDCCNTPVEEKESAVERIGWIDLGERYILNYTFHGFFETICGPKVLRAIIRYDDGSNCLTEDLIENSYQKENPYHGKGIRFLKENTIEVLEYFATDAKKKRYLEYIKANMSSVWTNKIPVLSISLRPAVITDGTMKFDILNRFYISILKELKIINNTLGEDMPLVTEPALARLQYDFLELCKHVVDVLHGKNGWIRSNMIGVRINFSARNVIVPNDSKYVMDEVVLPYRTCLELYKYELINMIKQLKNLTFAEAERVWWSATLKFDKTVYALMKKAITDYNVRVLINRNPTINYGSILCCRVADIKKDFDDQCMGISLLVLPLLAADFDGDVLNIISIKDEETADLFERTFSPKKMVISNNNHKFNRQLNLDKDHITGIFSLCN